MSDGDHHPQHCEMCDDTLRAEIKACDTAIKAPVTMSRHFRQAWQIRKSLADAEAARRGLDQPEPEAAPE